VLDPEGQTRYARNLPAQPEPFLRAVQPFTDGLLVACECVHCWYWLADTCRDHDIPFVLGHAWAMNAVHGAKTQCDRKDAEAIARLLKGGNFPPAYAYPRERRSLHRGQRPVAGPADLVRWQGPLRNEPGRVLRLARPEKMRQDPPGGHGYVAGVPY